MKIEINLKILVLLVIFALVNKIDTYIIFIIVILLHELSHMIAGMLLKFKPKVLKLNPLGVSIEFYNYNENDVKASLKKILVYFSGPAINFIIPIILYFVEFDISLKTKIIYTNIILGIFNLLPILPLDGGKILKEILKNFFDYKHVNYFMIVNTKLILTFLTITYSIAILKIKNIAIFLLILYLWYLYIIEEKKSKILMRMYKVIEKN